MNHHRGGKTFPWPPRVPWVPAGYTMRLLMKPPTLSKRRNACGLVGTMLFKITFI